MIIRNILFPTDFSERDKLTEAYVWRFFRNFSAHITVLHVIDQSEPYPCAGGEFDERPCTKQLHETANARLAEVLPGLAADRVVLFGDIGTGIADCAEESGADLIMIPLHARPPLRRIFHDSVAAGVLDDERWRVWTTSRDSEGPGQEHVALQRITCIVSPESSRAVECAEELAGIFHATLSLGYAAIETPGPAERMLEWFGAHGCRPESGAHRIDRAVHAIRRQFEARFKLHVVECGAPSAAIAAIARRADADLIVVGRTEAERLGSPLHSPLYSIVRDAPCPVMVV
jgi:nucleotide-binding universal stress UspA family protein